VKFRLILLWFNDPAWVKPGYTTCALSRGQKLLYNCTMIELNIPGRGVVKLEHLVCDVNGTLALDGQLLPDIPIRLRNLRDRLAIHLLTADTHGQQTAIDQQLGLQSVRISPGAEGAQKADYILRLGADTVVAIGQGANDAGMLKAAAVGICVLSPEGAAIETLLNADLVVPDIQNAFELLDKPLRIVATLRK
jgi:soluble P-type ATPase